MLDNCEVLPAFPLLNRILYTNIAKGMFFNENTLKAYKIKSRVFFLWTDIETLIKKEPG